MSNRGKEVLKGTLMYRRKGSSLKKRVVTAYCGHTGGSDGVAIVAQLTINEDYEKVEKPGQKPKSMIPLEGAKIECSYISGGANGTVYSNPSRMSASPSPSPHGSSLGGSGSGSITGSGSGTISSAGGSYTFSITTQNGDLHEFLSESENDRLRWVKLLQLLLMFPYSTIPNEPTNQPIKESFRKKLDPKKYNANSVWPVYILPEEVGTSCSIIGIHVIALKSGVGDSIGRLEIYQAGDPYMPQISWDRDKMRRTGKTGNLVFIEIGRRCQGGPGLVWMYTGFNDAQALRETLHNFLFKGDGTAVAIPTQVAPPIYDVPRSSLDTSLPPSYKRHNSIPGYNNHVLLRSKSHDHDSGYPPSPLDSLTTPPQLEGPPVRLDKHPSIRRKNGSRPRDISRSNSTASFGSLSDRDMSFPPTARSGDAVEQRQRVGEEDSSGDSSRSGTPPEDDGDVIGQMDPEPTSGNGAPYYDSVPRRTSDGGIPNMQQRIVMSGQGGAPGHYEEMTHPKNGMGGFDGYVVMKSAERIGRTMSAPIPVSQRSAVPSGDDTYHHLQRKVSPQNSSSPRNRMNYDQLPTISEGRRLHPGMERPGPTNYENHPLPRDLKGVSVNYQPSYENVDIPAQGRRGSMNQDRYENVDSNRVQSPSTQNSNQNNCNGSEKKRKFSLRRRSSDKESVRLGVGGNGTGRDVKNGDPEGYVVIQSKSEYSETNSASLSSAGYSSVDYQSTEVLGSRQQRQHQGQYHRSQVMSSEN